MDGLEVLTTGGLLCFLEMDGTTAHVEDEKNDDHREDDQEFDQGETGSRPGVLLRGARLAGRWSHVELC